MKLFSKLFLTLTLIASSANAVLDPYNLPTEVPTDLQEKLAWGLIKRDLPVIDEALNAGANPLIVFDVISDEPVCPLAEARTSAYAAITYKSKGIFEASKSSAAMLAEMDDFSRCAEFLIKKGVHVDLGMFQKGMFDPLTFREAYMRDPEYVRFGKDLPAEVEQCGKEMIIRIQKLMTEYQPLQICGSACQCDAAKQWKPAYLDSSEIPTDPQEKLVWGLYNSNKKVVIEAVEAGANLQSPLSDPSLCGYSLSLIGTNDTPRILEERINKHIQENNSINVDELANLAQTIRKVYEIWEFLIIKGVSVDNDLGWPFSTVRSLINDAPERNNYDMSEEPEYAKEYVSYMLILARSLQALIEKHQPEAKA